MSSRLRVPTQFYQQFDADYSRAVPAEGYGGWQTAEIEIDPQRTALVVMHAWDCGTTEEYPGWFRCCAEIPETYRVCRDVLPGLLDAVRKSPIALFHVVAKAGYYQTYPGYQRAVALAGPPVTAPTITPDPTYEKLQQFRNDRVFVGTHNQADVARGWARVRFAPPAEPRGEEGIAENADQLFALCQGAGVNHLIYVGFNLDWCLLMSPGGMIDMSRRGLICSTLRQAVTAVENKETARGNLAKEIGLWRVSVGFGFVFDVTDFVRAIHDHANH
ncbi:MAG: hypothetical protein PCFJNLEI_01642 [Verrucomicrobiae bacterium]|nr:hypothetical protein [Verrucomicrobiae bacterium]